MTPKPFLAIRLAFAIFLSCSAVAQTGPFSFHAYAEQLVEALSLSPDNLATNEAMWIPQAVFSNGDEIFSMVETESTAPQLRRSFKAMTNSGIAAFSVDWYFAPSRVETLKMLCVAMGAPSSLPADVFADSFCTTNLPSSIFVAWETNAFGTVEATFLADGRNVLHVFDSVTNSVELICSLYYSSMNPIR